METNTGAIEDPHISPDYEKSLLNVYTDFTDYCTERSNSLDILGRDWAPLPKSFSPEKRLRMGNSAQNQEEMPTWIPVITRSAFGVQGVLGSRIDGDSFFFGAAEL
jgi:hypothetical protein